MKFLYLLFLAFGFATSASAAPSPRFVGETDTVAQDQVRFAWPGTQILFRFRGTWLEVRFEDNGANSFAVETDGKLSRLDLRHGAHFYRIAENLPPGEHSLILTRRTEGRLGVTLYQGASTDGALLPVMPRPRRILVLGDSITAGYGIEGENAQCQNQHMTYAARIARAFDADLVVRAASGRGLIRNSDGSTTETLPAIMERIIPGEPRTAAAPMESPGIILINLGSNDFIAGVDKAEFEVHYTRLLTKLRARYPSAWIYSMAGPFLEGEAAGSLALALQASVEVRKKAGDRKLRYQPVTPLQENEKGCDAHPSLAAHRRIATELSEAIQQDAGWKPEEYHDQTK